MPDQPDWDGAEQMFRVIAPVLEHMQAMQQVSPVALFRSWGVISVSPPLVWVETIPGLQFPDFINGIAILQETS